MKKIQAVHNVKTVFPLSPTRYLSGIIHVGNGTHKRSPLFACWRNELTMANYLCKTTWTSRFVANFAIRFAAWVVAASLGLGFFSSTASAQPPQTDAATLQAEIDKLFQEWRELLKIAAQHRIDYLGQDRAESVVNRQKYETAFDNALRKKMEIEVKLIEKLDVVDKPDKTLLRMVKSIAQDLFIQERMERCYHLSKKLLQFTPDDDDILLLWGGSAMVTNRFDDADKFRVELGSLISGLPENIRYLYDSDLNELRNMFAKEQEKRDAEAKANDLPRVLIRTTKGDFVVELYENEAPNTVGNFIFLVETGYYNRELPFHRVISGFVAQGAEDTTGQPHYNIFDEHGSPNDRPHFAYTLAMARTDQANTAAAEFYITFCPLLGLNQRYTTFGRVIEGFDVVDCLNRTAKKNSDGVEEPIKNVVMDKILLAKVLRKRPHEYRPKIFSQSKPLPGLDAKAVPPAQPSDNKTNDK
ncbi:MAG: peptidylprolyl isomerase [Pirellulaceae bacterium]